MKKKRVLSLVVMIAIAVTMVLGVGATTALAAGTTVNVTSLQAGDIINAGDTLVNNTTRILVFSGGTSISDSIAPGDSIVMPSTHAQYRANNGFTENPDPVGATNYLSLDDSIAISVTASEGGTASADKDIAFPLQYVNLTATPDPGYEFKEWVLEEGKGMIEAGKIQLYGGAGVKIKAVFERSGQSAGTVFAPDGGELPALMVGTAAENPNFDGSEYVVCTATPFVLDTGWAVASGNLPAGLSLRGFGGYCMLEGTPTEAGTYTFTISATLASGDVVTTKEFTVTVSGNTPAPTGNTTDDMPKTGDAVADSIMMAILLLAACGAIGIFAAKKGFSK